MAAQEIDGEEGPDMLQPAPNLFKIKWRAGLSGKKSL